MAGCFRVNRIIQTLLILFMVLSLYILHINLSSRHNHPYKCCVIGPQARH
ncbi:hypothetical protein HanPSC8_Chr02g0080771 [Helianthus annuus]|nr:hypothetical protein HanPSC8_Chr02g0080771 [Helianthus annuus]